MNVRAFLDTNVVVYAFDPVVSHKSKTAGSLMRALSERGAGYISTQVVHEFFNVAFRKFQPKMTWTMRG